MDGNRGNEWDHLCCYNLVNMVDGVHRRGRRSLSFHFRFSTNWQFDNQSFRILEHQSKLKQFQTTNVNSWNEQSFSTSWVGNHVNTLQLAVCSVFLAALQRFSGYRFVFNDRLSAPPFRWRWQFLLEWKQQVDLTIWCYRSWRSEMKQSLHLLANLYVEHRKSFIKVAYIQQFDTNNTGFCQSSGSCVTDDEQLSMEFSEESTVPKDKLDLTVVKQYLVAQRFKDTKPLQRVL